MTSSAEIRLGGSIWRVEAENIGDEPHVKIWPYYGNANGEIKAGRCGLQFPVSDADLFIEAVSIAANRKN